jgi:hypothetical protein
LRNVSDRKRETKLMRENKKIKRVSYGRTINMGNYESVRLDLVADVPADERWQDVLDELKCEMLRLEKQTRKEGF